MSNEMLNNISPEENTQRVVELMDEIIRSVKENNVRAAFVALVNDEGVTFGWEIPIMHGSTMVGAIELGKARFMGIMDEYIPK